jgi:hypothetical protein
MCNTNFTLRLTLLNSSYSPSFGIVHPEQLPSLQQKLTDLSRKHLTQKHLSSLLNLNQ